VNRQLLAELARRSPLLPGKDVLAFVDIDSMQKRVYGHKKQGARFGHTKIQGAVRRRPACAGLAWITRESVLNDVASEIGSSPRPWS
jgi:hypothetical protein